MPFTALRESFPDRRFLAAALALTFVILPSVAFGLSRLARRHGPSISAVLTVLLTPCTDYVIVFTRLAAEATEAVRGRALAAARSPQASAIAIAWTQRRSARRPDCCIPCARERPRQPAGQRIHFGHENRPEGSVRVLNYGPGTRF